MIADRTTTTLDPDEIRRIARKACGNPLFAEQLLAALAEADVDVVPASLRSLLAMRLDRLGPAERDLLRCAAVIGTECDETALLAVLPDAAHPSGRTSTHSSASSSSSAPAARRSASGTY